MPASIMSPEVAVVLDQARSPQTRRVIVGDRTVEIPTPVPSPEDWQDQWIYFLLVDRFNNPQAPPRFAPFERLGGCEKQAYQASRSSSSIRRRISSGTGTFFCSR